jgi:aminoglycoside phosphotransferase (APT) family kinase protein
VEQPVVVEDRAVTFWHDLPPHEPGSSIDVAAALRRFHALPPPKHFELPELHPFVRLAERIQAASVLSGDDRAWMLGRLAALQGAYDALPPGLPHAVVHGDAWEGNVVRTCDGDVVLLDFERCALGPPEWDLVSTAVSHVTTDWMNTAEWATYSRAYGFDVTTWAGFDALRDIRELRMTTMAIQVASINPARYANQAAHRLACLHGRHGSRPWSGWHAVP